jgi:GT2 family glycosyltransferase
MKQSPGISLIVCSRNRPELLLETVESVLRGEQVPTEIIVVDQSDVPHGVLSRNRECRGCRIRYRWTDSRGVSVARNAGAVSAQHALLIFTDDDMIAACDWLGVLADALICLGPRAVVTGQVAPADAHSFTPSIKVAPRPALYEGRTGSDILYTGNMALYRASLIEVGGFDERLGPGTAFPAAEDNDLGFRLLEAGYRIAYIPGAVMYHRAWRSRREDFILRWRYGLGQGAFYAKHLSLKDRYMLRRILRDLVSGIRGIARMIVLKPYRATAELLYVLGLMTGAAGWLWTHRHPLERPGL